MKMDMYNMEWYYENKPKNIKKKKKKNIINIFKNSI